MNSNREQAIRLIHTLPFMDNMGKRLSLKRLSTLTENLEEPIIVNENFMDGTLLSEVNNIQVMEDSQYYNYDVSTKGCDVLATGENFCIGCLRDDERLTKAESDRAIRSLRMLTRQLMYHNCTDLEKEMSFFLSNVNLSNWSREARQHFFCWLKDFCTIFIKSERFSNVTQSQKSTDVINYLHDICISRSNNKCNTMDHFDEVNKIYIYNTSPVIRMMAYVTCIYLTDAQVKYRDPGASHDTYLEVKKPIANGALEDSLRKRAKEMKNQLNIIIPSDSLSYDTLFVNIEDGTDSCPNMDARYEMSALHNELRDDMLAKYGFVAQVTQDNLFRLSIHLKGMKIYIGRTQRGIDCYYVPTANELYLVAQKFNEDGAVYLLNLQDDDGKYHSFLKGNAIAATDNIRYNRISFKDTECTGETALTEGIRFEEDGGFRITLNPKRKYMDEYAEYHRVIITNYKSGNIDGMKTDLFHLFVLINHLESNVINSLKPVSGAKLEDAKKARMFAMNDFKSYLKIVQKHDPSFDFYNFYKVNYEGDTIFDIKSKEITGIKRLLAKILM